MTKEEIINGLQFTVDMFQLDPDTGEIISKPRNEMDKITIDACKGAIELIKEQIELENKSVSILADSIANIMFRR